MLLRWGAVALCLPLGAGLAFLTLESVGTPFMSVVIIIFLALLVRPFRFPETLILFGAGFTVVVAFFLVRTSGVLSGEATAAGTALFLGSLAVGIAILGTGVVLLGRRVSGVRPPGET
jgi:hypothetical protein